MSNINALGGQTAAQVLGAFSAGAAQGDSLRVTVEGQQFHILAQGELPTAGGGPRSVAWVQDDIDTTGLFLQALAAACGTRVSAAISDALGLEPTPGKPLASRAVEQALAMASTSQQALSGVDFLTRLDHSAQAGGPAFRQALAGAGISAAPLSAEQKQQIDSQMSERFAAAAAAGKSPVAPAQAAAWLDSVLRACHPAATQ
jgi:hypothetical protein